MTGISQPRALIYLARHGETAWTVSGQHTGLTDLPLTTRGKRNARALGERIKDVVFSKVFSSPLKRTLSSCELAGFGAETSVDNDLVEWDYGAFEGKTRAEIHKLRSELGPLSRRLSRRRVSRGDWKTSRSSN